MRTERFAPGEPLWLHGQPVRFCYYHAGGGGAVVRLPAGAGTRVVPLGKLSRERRQPERAQLQAPAAARVAAGQT